MRTVLIVNAERYSENAVCGCHLECTRTVSRTVLIGSVFGIDFEELQTWFRLPPDSREEDLSGWAGSSEEEKGGARGLAGFFQNTEEVDKFVVALRSATAV